MFRVDTGAVQENEFFCAIHIGIMYHIILDLKVLVKEFSSMDIVGQDTANFCRRDKTNHIGMDNKVAQDSRSSRSRRSFSRPLAFLF